jgi:hypothetical protein
MNEIPPYPDTDLEIPSLASCVFSASSMMLESIVASLGSGILDISRCRRHLLHSGSSKPTLLNPNEVSNCTHGSQNYNNAGERNRMLVSIV